MSEPSNYSSRPGKISCKAEKAYFFITDLRNFGRFARKETITDWQAEKDTCSFSIAALGRVHLRIKDKEPGNRVVFEGDALSRNDFSIEIRLSDVSEDAAEVNLTLSAELNPVMKMMADKPIRQFMEYLLMEIENFRDWEDITL